MKNEQLTMDNTHKYDGISLPGTRDRQKKQYDPKANKTAGVV